MKINQAEKIFLNLIETAGDATCHGFYCRPGQCPIKTYQAKNDIDSTCSNTGAASIAKILLNNESEPKMKPLSDEVVKAAETLIAKYEGLTLKDVQSLNSENITGFGRPRTCLLCIAVNYSCNDGNKCEACIYGEYTGCGKGENKDTFDLIIKHATTPIELLKAYYDRAQRLRELLKLDAEEKEKTKNTVDLAPLHQTANLDDPKSGKTLICVRTVKEFAWKAFYLGEEFNWEMKKDRLGNLCLIPTRKS